MTNLGVAAFVVLVAVVGWDRTEPATGGSPKRTWTLLSSEAPTDLVMTVAPTELTVAPGDETTVVVEISNPNPTPATIRSIELLVPSRVTARLDGGEASFTIEPGARVTRRVQIAVGRDAAPGDLVVLADVDAPAPADSGLTTEGYLVATVDLATQDRTSDVTVSIVSAPSDLSDGQSDAKLAVLLHNTTSFELIDIEFHPISSMDVDVVSTAGAHPCSPEVAAAGAIACLDGLAPGRAEVVIVTLGVDDRVRTGTQKVGVTFSGLLDAPAEPLATSSSATTEVKLSVFGVDALGPLGSTTLFVLPGMLAILTFVSFGRLAYPRTSWIPAKVDVTDTKVAAAALPIATVVYLLVWLVWGHNLTRELSTLDVVLLFALGVGLGFGVWAAFAVTYGHAIGRRQYKVGDSPKRVLQRVAWGKASLTCPTVSSVPGMGRLLGPGVAGKVAVCSPITFRFTAAAQAGDAAARDAFRTAVENDDRETVVHAIGSVVTVSWRAGGVRYLDAAAVTTGSTARLLEEQT